MKVLSSSYYHNKQRHLFDDSDYFDVYPFITGKIKRIVLLFLLESYFKKKIERLFYLFFFKNTFILVLLYYDNFV